MHKNVQLFLRFASHLNDVLGDVLMSQEAIGENEAVLGRSQYWNRVNRSTFFGGLMGRPSETDYH